MSERRAVQLVGLLVVVAALIGLALLAPDAIRVVVGLALLIVPGFALASALLPAGSLDPSRRATVGLASGVALAVLGGMLLNQLPPGLSAAGWIALSVIVAVVSLAVALVRGHVTLPGWASRDRWSVAIRGRSQSTTPRAIESTFPSHWPPGTAHATPAVAHASTGGRSSGLPGIPLMSLALSIILAITALSIARAGAIEADRGQAFTEFWGVPDGATPGSLRLGITSHEPEPTEYSILIDSGGRPIATFGPITLDPGATWESPSDVAAPTPTAPLHATLFRAGSATPYRELMLHGPAPS